jgi:hypothetical protein
MKRQNVKIRFSLRLAVGVSAGVALGAAPAEAVRVNGTPTWPRAGGGAVLAAGRTGGRAAVVGAAPTYPPIPAHAPSRPPPIVQADAYTDQFNKRGSGSRTYKICAAAFRSCSHPVSVRFCAAGAAISRAARPARDGRVHGGRRHRRPVPTTHRGKKR